MSMSIQEAVDRLRAEIERGRPIVGAGAGTGLSAKCAEAGGADIIIIYNSGRYRMAGRGSLAGLLPYGDANAVVVDMAREVLPIVKHVPVLAGVCATDPFRRMPVFLKELRELGFAGVQNFPTVGLIDGHFRQNLEETDMGFGLEIDMIRSAHELGMLTCPYVFGPDDARAMAEAGADILVAHMGLTTAGTIGAQTAKTLDECVTEVQAIHDAGVAVNPDVIVLCHGGPIAQPAEVSYVLERTTGVDGFFGASSVERLPTEVAIVENMRRLKTTVAVAPHARAGTAPSEPH
jgi:predicted TIM-barrel enzyme